MNQGIVLQGAISPLLLKEGWTRHLENGPFALKGADGVVRKYFTTPVAPTSVASRHFLDGAATPPSKGGDFGHLVVLVVVLMLFIYPATALAQSPIQIARQVGKAGRQNQQKQQALRPNARPNANRPVAIENLVEGLYISRFPEMVQVSDEQFAKILPLIRNGMRELRDIAAVKRRAMNQLIRMTQGDGTDENMKHLVQAVDKANEDYQSALQEFFNSVDPLLSPTQQARFRVFQDRFDQQIRQMLNTVAAPPPGQD